MIEEEKSFLTTLTPGGMNGRNGRTYKEENINYKPVCTGAKHSAIA